MRHRPCRQRSAVRLTVQGRLHARRRKSRLRDRVGAPGFVARHACRLCGVGDSRAPATVRPGLQQHASPESPTTERLRPWPRSGRERRDSAAGRQPVTADDRALIRRDFAAITEKERADAQIAESPANAGAEAPSSRFRCVDPKQILREPAVSLGQTVGRRSRRLEDSQRRSPLRR